MGSKERIEIKDGDPMISDINLSGSLDAVITTPPLNVTPTGLSPTKSPDSTPEVSSSHSTKPLFVFHLKDSKAGGTEDLANQIEVATDGMTQVSLYTAESNLVHDNKCDRSGELSEEQLKKKKNQQLLSKLNILDKVHTLPVTSPVDGIRSITPQLTPSSTPRSTPRTTPLASPVLKRKVAGVVMEHNASHSYFCTKPYQNSQHSDTSPQSGNGELALSTTSTQMTQQLESASKVAMAMEAGQKLGKKRRPKPSSLREMNFWAPTSM